MVFDRCLDIGSIQEKRIIVYRKDKEIVIPKPKDLRLIIWGILPWDKHGFVGYTEGPLLKKEISK